jgi:thiosulfate reductase cytochrome b subunit
MGTATGRSGSRKVGMADEVLGGHGGARRRRLHPWTVRATHWLNAVAMVLMIGSGWRIYNEEEIFAWLVFPIPLTFGGEPWTSFRYNDEFGFGGALQWHFAAMWLLVLNGLVYLAYGIASGRFRRMLLPIRLRELRQTVSDSLRLRLHHGDLTVYNAVQRLLYIGVILAIIVQVASGLAIWKPVQLSELTRLFYDFQGARLAHFLGMGAIVLFLAIHVALALLVPRTLVNMVTGGPLLEGRRGRGTTAEAEPGAQPAE